MKTRIVAILCMTILTAVEGLSQKKINKIAVDSKEMTASENSQLYSIQPLKINSAYSDFGPSFYQNKLVFTSTRGKISKEKGSNKYLTELYIADLDDNFPKKSMNFPNLPQVKVNESTAIFTRDGKTMYFTRNSAKTNEKGINTLVICSASLIGDKWENITELPFNQKGYNIANPALSPDEKTLYFASDLPGTIGNADIFKVSINIDGTFGKPKNLGASINTTKSESFPFVSDENILYFASTGHKGQGGFDNFTSEIFPDGTFGKVQNMGPTINSDKDDFSIIYSIHDQVGFFASNRNGGEGSDDIYRFTKHTELSNTLGITDVKENQITDKQKVKDSSNEAASSLSNDGNSTAIRSKKGQSAVSRSKDNQSAASPSRIGQSATSRSEDNQSAASPSKNGQSAASLSNDGYSVASHIQTLYFEYKDTAVDYTDEKTTETLAAIIKFHTQNPDVRFSIEGHSDSIGEVGPNYLLSEKRAQNVQALLIVMGIPKEKIVHVKGLGESKPLETNMYKHGRAINRRVEIIPIYPGQSNP